MTNISVVILAAGKGTRMNHHSLPKVLVPLQEKPLLKYVIDTALLLSPLKIINVVGYLADKVIDFCKETYDFKIENVIQEKQLGTGHAVMQAIPPLQNTKGDTLILAGDVPLITGDTLKKFINIHNETNADVSVLSTIAPKPFGYGRIIRDNENNFTKIIEQKDANETEKLVDEINSGIYVVNTEKLIFALGKITNNNAQGEYYLTDIIEIIRKNGGKVIASNIAEFNELQGINSPEDLQNVEKLIA